MYGHEWCNLNLDGYKPNSGWSIGRTIHHYWECHFWFNSWYFVCFPQRRLFSRSIRDVSNVSLPAQTGRVRQHVDPANPLQCEETPRQRAVPWVPLETALGSKGWYNWLELLGILSDRNSMLVFIHSILSGNASCNSELKWFKWLFFCTKITW